MLFRTLLKTTIQGDIRISIWEDDEEIEVVEFQCEDHLSSYQVKKYLNYYVKYVFATPGGILHIELSKKGSDI